MMGTAAESDPAVHCTAPYGTGRVAADRAVPQQHLSMPVAVCAVCFWFHSTEQLLCC